MILNLVIFLCLIDCIIFKSKKNDVVIDFNQVNAFFEFFLYESLKESEISTFKNWNKSVEWDEKHKKTILWFKQFILISLMI